MPHFFSSTPTMKFFVNLEFGLMVSCFLSNILWFIIDPSFKCLELLMASVHQSLSPSIFELSSAHTCAPATINHLARCC
ncbi:hypothetical protein L208DRAFT_1469648 [Tricholoma matsutake]|nr:hypothetical protein L208DRAFT_1469648 [Tricholoma matsutake 945]